MSILSALKGAKKAAEEQKAKEKAAMDARQPPKEPYRHVPTHAASDALSGAPSAWKAYDQPAIKDAHRKRLSRPQSVTSSLTAYSGQRPPMAKSYSYASGSATPASTRNSMRNSMVGVVNPPRASHWGYAAYAGHDASQHLSSRQNSEQFQQSLGGNGRIRSFHGKSPLGSQFQPSPPHSARSSQSSGINTHDGLEIAPIPVAPKTVTFSAPAEPPVPSAPQPTVAPPRSALAHKRRSTEAGMARSKTPSPVSGSPVLTSSPLATEVLPEVPSEDVEIPTAAAAAAMLPPQSKRPSQAIVTARAVKAEEKPDPKRKETPRPKKKRWLFFGKAPVAVAAH